MKSQTFFTDEALVLRKNSLKDSDQRVTLFTKLHGKISLSAFGTKSLLSRRLSHLETGNVIKCSWRESEDFAVLQETELQYAHSHIKDDSDKLDYMYVVLYVLMRILPDHEPESSVYEAVLAYLRGMHHGASNNRTFREFLASVMHELGYVDEEQKSDQDFDIVKLVEETIGAKLDSLSYTRSA